MNNKDYFNVIDIEEKAYWLGFIYADGCLINNCRISIDLSRRDRKHLEKLQIIFEGKIFDRDRFDKRTNKIYNGSYTYLNSVELCKDLIDKGIHNRKSLSNSLDIFNKIPINLMRHFIRGFFDGDGYFDRRNRCYFFSLCGHETVLLYIENIFLNNIKLNELSKVENRKNNLSYIMWRNKNDVGEILTWLYKDTTVYLDRKKELIENYFKI